MNKIWCFLGVHDWESKRYLEQSRVYEKLGNPETYMFTSHYYLQQCKTCGAIRVKEVNTRRY